MKKPSILKVRKIPDVIRCVGHARVVILMSVELGKDEVFSSAVAGLPKVAELIATDLSKIESEHWMLQNRAISKPRGDWATKEQMLCNGQRR